MDNEYDPEREADASSEKDGEGDFDGPDFDGDCVFVPIEFVVVMVTSFEILSVTELLIEYDSEIDRSFENDGESENVTD